MVRRFSYRKALGKLRSREYKRRRAVGELVEQHERFIKTIGVLDALWRRELLELMAGEDEEREDGEADGSGVDLVQSIFPSLESIRRTAAAASPAECKLRFRRWWRWRTKYAARTKLNV